MTRWHINWYYCVQKAPEQYPAVISWNLWISYLYDAFEIGEKVCKKGNIEGREREVDKICIEVQKNFWQRTEAENLHAVSHFIQHKTLSSLNYAQDFGNWVKESLKVTPSSYFVRAPSYFEALWYPHLYFDRNSNM